MERRPTFWERVLGERAAYLTFVRASLCEHAMDGNLVYHGLLGHLLLPGISHVIAVRVIADMEFRIQAAIGQQNLPRERALAYIERMDRERREWTRFLFEVNWDDPHLFDLVLNLSRISVETACEMVVRLAERGEFKPTAVSQKAAHDLALKSRVSAVLARDFRTRDADLKVTADDGTVTVTGTTWWQEVVEAVPKVLSQIDGVKKLQCEITGATPPVPLTWY